MSKDATQTSEKDAGRKRYNLSLPEDVKVRGEQLAEADRRSFANFVEVLIDNEWKKRHPENGAAEAA